MSSMLFIDLIFGIYYMGKKDVYERLERGYIRKEDMDVEIVMRQKGFPAKETRIKEYLKQSYSSQLQKRTII